MRLSNRKIIADLVTEKDKLPVLMQIFREEFPDFEISITWNNPLQLCKAILRDANIAGRLPQNEIGYLTDVAAYDYPMNYIYETPYADTVKNSFERNFPQILNYHSTVRPFERPEWFIDKFLMADRIGIIPQQYIPMFLITLLNTNYEYLEDRHSIIFRTKFEILEYKNLFSPEQLAEASNKIKELLSGKGEEAYKNIKEVDEAYTADQMLQAMMEKYKDSYRVEYSDKILDFATKYEISNPELILKVLRKFFLIASNLYSVAFQAKYPSLDYAQYLKDMLNDEGEYTVNLLIRQFVNPKMMTDQIFEIFLNSMRSKKEIYSLDSIRIFIEFLSVFTDKKEELLKKVFDAYEITLTDLYDLKAITQVQSFLLKYSFDAYSDEQLKANLVNLTGIYLYAIKISKAQVIKILELAKRADAYDDMFGITLNRLKEGNLNRDAIEYVMSILKETNTTEYCENITNSYVIGFMGKEDIEHALNSIEKISIQTAHDLLINISSQIENGKVNLTQDDLKEYVIRYLKRPDCKQQWSIYGAFGPTIGRNIILNTILDNITPNIDIKFQDIMEWTKSSIMPMGEDKFYKILEDYFNVTNYEDGVKSIATYFNILGNEKSGEAFTLPPHPLDWKRIFEMADNSPDGHLFFSSFFQGVIENGGKSSYLDGLTNEMLQEQFNKYSIDSELAIRIYDSMPLAVKEPGTISGGKYTVKFDNMKLLKSALHYDDFFDSDFWQGGTNNLLRSLPERQEMAKAMSVSMDSSNAHSVISGWQHDYSNPEDRISLMSSYFDATLNYTEYDNKNSWLYKTKILNQTKLGAKYNGLNIPPIKSNLYDESTKNRLFLEEAQQIKDIVGENPLDALADLMGGKNTGGLKKIKILYNSQLQHGTSLHDIAVALQGEKFQAATKDKQYGNAVLSYVTRRADYAMIADLISAAAKLPIYLRQKRVEAEGNAKKISNDPKEIRRLVEEELKAQKLPSVVELLKVGEDVQFVNKDVPLSNFKNTMYKYSESKRDVIDEYVDRLSREPNFGDVEGAIIKPIQKIYDIDGRKYRIEILRKDDPLGMVLGERLLTSCCQKLKGQGQRAMERGFLRPDHAFSVLYRENDETPVSQGILYYHVESPIVPSLAITKRAKKYKELSQLEPDKEYYFNEQIGNNFIVGWYMVQKMDNGNLQLSKTEDRYLLFDSIEFHDIFVKGETEEGLNDAREAATRYLDWLTGEGMGEETELKWHDVSLDKTKSEIEAAWKQFAKDLRDIYKARMVSLGTGYTDFDIEGLPKTPENKYVRQDPYDYSDADYSLSSKYTVRLALSNRTAQNSDAPPEIQKIFIGDKKKKKKIKLSNR